MNKMLLVQKNLQLYQYQVLEQKLSKPRRRLLRLPSLLSLYLLQQNQQLKNSPGQ